MARSGSGGWPDPAEIYLTRQMARELVGWSDFALAARIASGELRVVETLPLRTGRGLTRRHLYRMSDVLKLSTRKGNGHEDLRRARQS